LEEIVPQPLPELACKIEIFLVNFLMTLGVAKKSPKVNTQAYGKDMG